MGRGSLDRASYSAATLKKIADIEEMAVNRVSDYFQYSLCCLRDDLLTRVESPIEFMLGFALGAHQAPFGFRRGDAGHCICSFSNEGADYFRSYLRFIKQDERRGVLEFYSQIEILEYRADFVLIAYPYIPGTSVQKLIIECDGHDFHEKTKEQAQRDKERDRKFSAEGYTVLRFTGSEIFQDATGCAKQIMDHIGAAVMREVHDDSN